MTTSTTAKTSTNLFATSMFWERLWRASGIISVVLFVVAYVIFGYQPPVREAAE